VRDFHPLPFSLALQKSEHHGDKSDITDRRKLRQEKSRNVENPRLVYTFGIWPLAISSGLLLVIFGGVTGRLIPLFAAFTMPQAGMVAQWRKRPGFHARKSLIITLLMLDGDERIAVINVPWYFEQPRHRNGST
jgi:hypothetical protein